MDQFLRDKVALVTGGSRGIGKAIAYALSEAGANVAICGRDSETVAQAVNDLSKSTRAKVTGKAADVSNIEEVASLFQTVDAQYGALDILVNNAGVGNFGAVPDLSPEQWNRTIGTNLTGVYYCCREAIPRMRNRGGGSLINISSLAGTNAFAGGSAYNASKFALNGFSEAVMLDHRYDNIRVSYVMPGSVATEFGSPRGSSATDWKIAPEDIADIVLTILRMPERTLISRVEVRPSKPRKK